MKKEPKWLAGNAMPNNLKMARRHEKKSCRQSLVDPTVGSGNKRKKGDGQSKCRYLECKATEGKSMSVKREWLETAYYRATQNMQEPVISLRFDGMSIGPSDWAVIPMDRYEELLELERRLQDEF